MSKFLVAWIGQTDLNACANDGSGGLGPIAGAVLARSFDGLLLLNNYANDAGQNLIEWLGEKAGHSTKITLHQADLVSPVDYESIYRAAVAAIENLRNESGQLPNLTFHLSPGTPAMAAVWLLLAATRYDACLVDSSRESGLRDIDLPFEIAAEFVPALLNRSDQRIGRLVRAEPQLGQAFDSILHRSPSMAALLKKAELIAPRSVPVLIQGESGTGKELLAHAIHEASPRRRKKMIAVNCGAIPADIVESTLFGHVQGAFTGANKNQQGLFRAADRSTLFLDEIGDLTPLTQVKLLRALEEGCITPVGATEAIKIDVRIIAATNRSIVDDVVAGRFRSDLYYRLAVAILTLPPLRHREGDTGLLIDAVLKRVNQNQQVHDPAWKNKEISPAARNLLFRHSWPGNVRELVATLTRAVIWSSGTTIENEDIEQSFMPAVLQEGMPILDRALGNSFDINVLMADIASHYLKRAMQEANGNKTKAAKLMGLPSYQTLNNWLDRYGIEE